MMFGPSCIILPLGVGELPEFALKKQTKLYIYKMRKKTAEKVASKTLEHRFFRHFVAVATKQQQRTGRNNTAR